jgi:hypothetical protein
MVDTIVAAATAVIPATGSRECAPDDRLRRVSSTPRVLDSTAGGSEYWMLACVGMTDEYTSAFSRRDAPEFCKFVRPKK